MPDAEKRYWDSTVFLASIKNEPGRADVCENIINDARAGRCEIWTSTLTLAEVVKRRPRESPIDPQTETVIAEFFKNPFIRPVPLDAAIAGRARRLIWEFPWLVARDAIHIATALQVGVTILEHYDDDDIGRVGERVEREMLTGFPEIRHPKWTGQIEMALPEVETVASQAIALDKSTDPGLDSPPIAPSPSAGARPALEGAPPEQTS